MGQLYNIYCDESCHLEHDGESAMTIGGIWCPQSKKNEIFHRIREIKEEHGLNKNFEITSEGMAIIPTEWKTEILCYEFKGKIDDTDFLVYTNVETGREENILVIINTPNGILTQ